jgi:capsular exopolysaccharide synthesis family protein
LIDADLRKPRIHKIFGLNNAKGLSTYLSGASDMNVIQEGPLPNLGVIPSGPIPPNPSELLSSVRVSEMIAALGERYDIIIIDSPPLLTVADSLVLSKVPDGTILVTMAGKTTYDLAQRGLKSLASLDARVLGMVINGMDIKKGDYYYYRYHNYYYSSEEADT